MWAFGAARRGKSEAVEEVSDSDQQQSQGVKRIQAGKATPAEMKIAAPLYVVSGELAVVVPGKNKAAEYEEEHDAHTARGGKRRYQIREWQHRMVVHEHDRKRRKKTAARQAVDGCFMVHGVIAIIFEGEMRTVLLLVLRTACALLMRMDYSLQSTRKTREC